jgi:hypothetical protein
MDKLTSNAECPESTTDLIQRKLPPESRLRLPILEFEHSQLPIRRTECILLLRQSHRRVADPYSSLCEGSILYLSPDYQREFQIRFLLHRYYSGNMPVFL